jgi:hypothetical protein
MVSPNDVPDASLTGAQLTSVRVFVIRTETPLHKFADGL